MTIHKFYNKVKKNKNMLNGIKYISINEVSMLKEFFYHFFLSIKSSNPEIKFVLSGDWRQCQLVCDCYQESYKNSWASQSLVNRVIIQLTNCRRSDTKLYELSKNVNAIDTKLYKTEKIIYNNLCFTNNKRKQINDKLIIEFIKMKNVSDVVYHLKKDGERYL